eukprot:8204705-Alexandrium_andersonii.AAC.1
MVGVDVEAAPIGAWRTARQEVGPASPQDPNHSLPATRLIEVPARPVRAGADVEDPCRAGPQAWATLGLRSHRGGGEHPRQ